MTLTFGLLTNKCVHLYPIMHRGLYTMTATNHDGHSNEKVKNQQQMYS